MLYADSMAFARPQMQDPILDPTLEDVILHLTSAPPVAVRGASCVSLQNTLAMHTSFRQTLETQEVRILLSKRDVGLGRQVVLGLQCAPADTDPENLAHELFDAGIRIVTPVYAGEHPFGGGSDRPEIGLTDAGKKFVHACGKFGLSIDLSHVGNETARGIINLIRTEQLPVKY